VRRLAVGLASLMLAGCGEEADVETPAATPAPAATELTVRVDPDGNDPRPAREAVVRCPGDAACEAVEALRPRDFAPVGRAVACTQLFGGPQVATVTGTLRGEPVDARFTRVNGCEISRWDAVAPLLEAAG